MSNISRSKNFNLDHCKYRVLIKFYCYDALTGKNLKIDSISIDEDLIYHDKIFENTENVKIINDNGQFKYEVQTRTTLNFNIKIEKTNYFPFQSDINLVNYNIDKNFSVHDEILIVVDLGKFPLLSLEKTNAIVLSWNEYPHDLDAYLTNPDNTQTYYEKPSSYFSNVDIDDKRSYGPETISVIHWTDLDNQNAVNTTFKYDVNWYKDSRVPGTPPVSSINASVSLFVDPENPKTFSYPKALDTINREGYNWHVFELDVLSVYDNYEIPQNNLLTTEFINENVQSNLKYYQNFEEYENFSDYYYKLFSYNFLIKIFNQNNEDVTNSFEIGKIYLVDKRNYRRSFYYFDNPNNINTNNLTIKLFLNEKYERLGIVYFSTAFNSIYSAYYYDDNNNYISKSRCLQSDTIFNKKFILFEMYGYDDEKVENVKYRWDTRNNRLYIEILNRKYTLSQIKKFKYFLGVDYTINYNTLYDQNNDLCKTPNDLYWYLYSYKNLFKDVKYFKTENNINVISNLLLDNENTNYYFKDSSIFNVYAIPYSEFTREFELERRGVDITNSSNYFQCFVKSIIKNRSTASQQIYIDNNDLSIDSVYEKYNDDEIIEILSSNIPDVYTNDLKIGSNIIKHLKIEKIIDLKTNSFVQNFEYEWDNTGVLIKFNESYNDNDFEIIFKFISLSYTKKELNYGLDENGKEYAVYPSVYIYEDEVELNHLSYYSIWNPTNLKIIFKNDLKKNAYYTSKIIDYLKIYKFNVYELNYFDKTFKVNFDIINYDDYILSGNEYVLGDTRQKLSNINFNFFTRNYRRSDNTFDLIYATAEPTSQNSSYNYIRKYQYDLTQSGIRGNWDYLASFKTIYSHNDFYENIIIYDETPNKCTRVNSDNYEEKTYKLNYPLVNFYGWFVDSLGNDIRHFVKFYDENFTDPHMKQYVYRSFLQGESNKLKIRLVNTDPELSSQLIYRYGLYYEYDHGYDYGTLVDGARETVRSGWYEGGWKEEYENVYSFFFKQKFRGDFEYPDNDCDSSYISRGNRYAIFPGKYDMELYLNDNLLHTYKDFDLTKVNEEKRNTYNVNLQFPLINFTGIIKNINTGDKEFTQGLIINLYNDNTSVSFKYGEFNSGDYEKYNEYDEDEEPHYDSYYLNIERDFKFLFQGFNFQHDMYSYEYFHASMGIPEGVYNLEIKLEDEIFYLKNDFIISSNIQNELYDYVIESPLCTLNGRLLSNGTVVYGNDWHIILVNKNDSSKNRTFDYDSPGYKKNFEFRGFGRLRNIPNEYRDNAYDIKYYSNYFSKGLYEGEYDIVVKYKNKEIKTFSNVIISKEKEALGLLNNYDLDIGEIYTTLSGRVIDAQFNNLVRKRGILSLSEENYDGNILDETLDNFSLENIYTNNRYQFNDLIKFGNYGIKFRNSKTVNNNSKSSFYLNEYDDWSENIPIMGVVQQTKSFAEIEQSNTYPSSYFDSFDKVSGTNIFYPAGTIHPSADLINLNEAISISGKSNYDIYVKYSYIFFTYDLYYDKISGAYYPNDTRFVDVDPRIPIVVKLENKTNDAQDDVIASFNTFSTRQNSYYLSTNTIKSGKYDVTISLDGIPGVVLYNKEHEGSQRNSYERQKIYLSGNLINFENILLTKYYSIDKNDLITYQVIPFSTYSGNNNFTFDLKYSNVQDGEWFNYYNYDSNSGSKNNNLDIEQITSYVYCVSGYENNSYYPIAEGIMPLKYSMNTIGFEQLYNNCYYKIENPKYNKYDVKILGIFNDSEESVASKIYPRFFNEANNSYDISGHISKLFNNNNYNHNDPYYNTLRLHLLSGDFDKSNNLLSGNNVFHSKNIKNMDRKIILLDSIKVNIYGKIFNKSNTSDLTFNGCMKLLVKLYKYDPDTNSETFVDSSYYEYYSGSNDGDQYKFKFDGIDTGLYKMRFFLNNIELFESERGKIHVFNFNEALYRINLENEFPSISGQMYFNQSLNSSSIDTTQTEGILINGFYRAKRRFDIDGEYILINNETGLGRIWKHINKNYYILTCSDTNRWIVTKFNYRPKLNELNYTNTFVISYDNRNNEPIDSFNYSFSPYYSNDDNYLDFYRSSFSKFKINNNVFSYQAIDHVFIDLINKDLNDYSYYGLNTSTNYSFDNAPHFLQNSSWNVYYYEENNYGKTVWNNLLEGDYKIKYFIAPERYNYYGFEWKYYNDLDSQYYLLCEANNNYSSIYNKVCEALTGTQKSFDISIDDVYSYISGYPQQFLDSENFRVFRIGCDFTLYDNNNSEYRHCYALLKFDDVWPSGNIKNNLGKNLSINVTINSNFENILPVKDANNFKYNSYRIRRIALAFADLMIDEDIKITSSTNNIERYLNYMYAYTLGLECNGYNWDLHNRNSNIKTNLFDNNNRSYGTYNSLTGPNGFRSDTRTNEYYGLRTNLIYNGKYLRGDFTLGETENIIIKFRENYEYIDAVDLSTLSGNYVNKSIEDCKKSSLIEHEKYALSTYIPYTLNTRLFFMGDENGNGGDESGYYYNRSYNPNSENNYTYSFDSLLMKRNDIVCRINYDSGMYEDYYEFTDNKPTKPILSVNFNSPSLIEKDIELPYIPFKVYFKYVDNKDGSEKNLPSNAFTLRRNQKMINSKDTFDKTYTLSSYKTFIKSGYYDLIEFKNDAITHKYAPTIINSDRTFKIYYNCSIIKQIKVLVKENGNPKPNCNVYRYDENNNLIEVIKTNSNGETNTFDVFNIPYKFKAIDENHEFVSVDISSDYQTIVISY